MSASAHAAGRGEPGAQLGHAALGVIHPDMTRSPISSSAEHAGRVHQRIAQRRADRRRPRRAARPASPASAAPGVSQRRICAGVQQRQPRAALRLVHVGGGEQDGDAAARAGRTGCAQKSRRDTGSTPVVGSSSSSTRGVWISAQTRPSFCFMPPESCPARRRAERAEPGRRQQFWRAARRDVVAGHREQRGVEEDVLRHRHVFIQAEALRHVAEVRLGALRIGARRRCRRARSRPHPGVSTPASMRMIVVLPAPSGPTRPKISPRVTAKLIPRTAATGPKRRLSPSATTAAAAGGVTGARPAAGRSARRPASPAAVRASDCRCRCGCDTRASRVRRGSPPSSA